jgi:hypothetical protein
VRCLLLNGADVLLGKIFIGRHTLTPPDITVRQHVFDLFKDDLEAFKECTLMIEANPKCGLTAIQLACEYGILEVVKSLVADGADVLLKTSQPSEGHTLLMTTSDAAIASYLIDCGVDVNAVDANGNNALQLFLIRLAPVKKHWRYFRPEEYVSFRAYILVLIERGTDLRHLNNKGQDASMFLIEDIDQHFLEQRGGEIEPDDWSLDGDVQAPDCLHFVSDTQHLLLHYVKHSGDSLGQVLLK